MDRISKSEVFKIAIYAGEIMLKNGAETYRVEDTINIICQSRQLRGVNSFVTPTGLFVSDNKADGISLIKRVESRTIDLDKISKVNSFARDFVHFPMGYEHAISMLDEIDSTPKYNPVLKFLAVGLASAFFALIIGARPIDFAAAFIISTISIIVYENISKISDTAFLSTAICSSIVTFFAIVSHTLGFGRNLDMIIVGAIMPLVPGVALTNGIRDLISGDLISGMARVCEAILIAISIAVGVGWVLKVWVSAFGGVL